MLSKEDIAQIMSVVQQGRRETQDGSHLNDPSYEEKLLDRMLGGGATNRAQSLASSVMDKKERNEKQQDYYNIMLEGYKKAGLDDADAKAKAVQDTIIFGQQLKEANQRIIDELLSLPDSIEEAKAKIKESLDKEASGNVFRTLSNGRSDKIASQGNSISTFGNSLLRIGGKKGMGGFGKALSVAGKSLSVFGGLVSKAAGPLGMLATAAKAALDYLKAGKELDANHLNFSAKQTQKQFGIERTKIGAMVQVAQNNASAASTAQSAMISAANSAQSAAGAFAQEAVGIHAEQAVEGKKIGYEAYAQSHEIVSELPFAIKESAYKAAEAALDNGSKVSNYEVNDKYAEKAVNIAARKMSNTISGAFGQAQASIDGANAVAGIKNAALLENAERNIALQERAMENSERDFTFTQIKGSDIRDASAYGMGWYQSWKYDNIKEPQFKVEQGQRNLDYAYQEGLTGALNQVTDGIANIEAINTQNYYAAKAANIGLATQQRDMQLSIEKQQNDMKKNIENAANEAALKVAKAWLKMTEKLNDTFLKHENATTIMGREMGLVGEQLEIYSSKMFDYQTEVSKWGKDAEWMQKRQGGYQENSGRNVEFSQRDFETTASVSLVAGEDNVARYTDGMEIFNHSVEDSNEKLYTMFKEVSRIGLNGKKYAKDLANNLKLAEKYNFKGGVDSLMRMSKWAQSMRFNVDSMDGMLDKVQTGGLEGVIKQSAELQVLGGNFAMGSDPLAMAYESYMDPEAYAKRMNKMVAGQGVFNSDTGEVSFAIASQQMMRQYAESTGQDYKDVLNQARAQVKIGEIEGSLNEDFSEEQKMAIANKAQYNQKEGKWQIQVGKEKKDVDTLTAKDIEKIMPSQDIQNDMLIELKSILSAQEKYNNAQLENMAKLEQEMLPNLIETNRAIVNSVGESFKTDFETYKNQAIGNLGLLKDAQKEFVDLFRGGDDDVDTKVEQIVGYAKEIRDKLLGVKESADKHVNAANNQKVPGYRVGVAGAGDAGMSAKKAELLKAEEERKRKAEEAKKKKLMGWATNADWAASDSNFLQLATVIKANQGPGGDALKAKRAFDDIAGNGLFDIKEGGYQEGMTQSDIVELYDFLVANGMAKDGQATTKAKNNMKMVQTGVAVTAPGALPSPTYEWRIDENKFDGNNDGAEIPSPSEQEPSAFSDWWNGWSVSDLWNEWVAEPFTTNIGQPLTDWWNGWSIKGLFDEYVATPAKNQMKRAQVWWNSWSIKGLFDEYIATPAKNLMTRAKEWWDSWSIQGLFDEYVATPVSNAAKRIQAWWDSWSIKGLFDEYVATPVSNAIKKIKEWWDSWSIKGLFDEYIATPASKAVKKIKEWWDSWSLGSVFKTYIAHPVRDTAIDFANAIIDVMNTCISYLNKVPFVDIDKFDSIRRPDDYHDWKRVNDGIIFKNGSVTKIDDDDQVLAAKQGGPVDKMINNVISQPQITPLPKEYDSFVRESLYHNGSSDGKIEIAPIQITFNGSIQLNGSNGMIDITQQIANDPNFIRSLSQMISSEMEKKFNGGKVSKMFG